MCVVAPNLRESCSPPACSPASHCTPLLGAAVAGMAKPVGCDGSCRKAVTQVCAELLMLPGCSTGAEPVYRGTDRGFGRLQSAAHAKGAVEQPGQDCLDYPVPESGYESSSKTTQVVVLPACRCSPLSCPSAEVRAAGSSNTSGAVAVH